MPASEPGVTLERIKTKSGVLNFTNENQLATADDIQRVFYESGKELDFRLAHVRISVSRNHVLNRVLLRQDKYLHRSMR
jgi:hypothetical protein